MSIVEVSEGDGPIVLASPHSGTHVPDDIRARLNDRGRTLADADWRVDQLYDGLLPSATRVTAQFHRYVIDANRDPSGASLYPGQNTTGLVPLTDFDGEPIWRAGQSPGADEIEARRTGFHAPYHAALEAQLARVQARWGAVILYDCHSIRARIPFLFEGALPDFNIGTNGGETCAPEIEAAVVAACEAARGFTCVLNARFKGGWTTRHYGAPGNGRHAIQMELAQRLYLETEAPPFAYSTAKAERLRAPLRAALEALDALARSDALAR